MSQCQQCQQCHNVTMSQCLNVTMSQEREPVVAREPGRETTEVDLPTMSAAEEKDKEISDRP